MHEEQLLIDLSEIINNHITDVIWVYNLEKNCFTYVSPSVYNLLGFTQQEALHEEWEKSIHPVDFQFIMSNLKSRISHYEAGEGHLRSLIEEIRLIRKDGTFLWVEMNTVLIRNSFGKVDNICGISRDISLRKSSDEALRNSKNIFETVFSFTGTGIALLHSDAQFKNVNMGLVNMLGYPKSFLMEKDFYYFIHTDDKEVLRKIFAINRFEKNYEGQTDVKLIHFNGDIIWGMVNINGVILPSNGELNWVIQIKDDSKRKEAEETIKTLNEDLKIKNKEMEQLVYITSHDLRSPLVNIKGFSGELNHSFDEFKKRLKQKFNDDHQELFTDIEQEIRESIDYIEISINKMDSLLKTLLDYSRLGKEFRSPDIINMKALLEEIVKTNEFLIKSKDIEIHIEDIPDCLASKEMINQAFSNLIENSLKYLDPEKKTIIRVYGHSCEKNSVYHVQDNGLGFDPALNEKVFELFFRANHVAGDGDGLGLSAVKKIIELNHGKIKANSKPGEGSIFTITLPGIKKQMQHPAASV